MAELNGGGAAGECVSGRVGGVVCGLVWCGVGGLRPHSVQFVNRMDALQVRCGSEGPWLQAAVAMLVCVVLPSARILMCLTQDYFSLGLFLSLLSHGAPDRQPHTG